MLYHLLLPPLLLFLGGPGSGAKGCKDFKLRGKKNEQFVALEEATHTGVSGRAG